MDNHSSFNLNHSIVGIAGDCQAVLDKYPEAVKRLESSGNELEKTLIAAVKRCAEVQE